MIRFFKAFGSMILTIVGIVTMTAAFFFWKNVEIFQFLLIFGIWFLFIPKLLLSEDKIVNISYLLKNKDYADAMFVLFIKIMMLSFFPLLALCFICDSTALAWGTLVVACVSILSLVACFMIVFIRFIISMYKDAMKKYRS